MYQPLVALLEYITTFREVSPREFQHTNGMLKPTEGHTMGFPSCSPDLTVCVRGSNARESQLWRHLNRDSFGEVKPSKNQGPEPGSISPIVIQAADYARLLLSSRPFMLFCVGILVFGNDFCVGIFDSNGITFSTIHNISEEMPLFIRVVRGMASLPFNELGFDPTVRLLSDTETRSLGHPDSSGYPSAVVSPVGNDHRHWCTIGPPIWSSMSFLGRGTHIWLVCEFVEENGIIFCKGNNMILKTSWRSSARTPESAFYMSTQAPPKGLAEFECGGDAMFAGFPMTVQNLRGAPIYKTLPTTNQPPTPVPHRPVIRTVGRPLWKAGSQSELLTAFRDALQCHKELCDRGILHRDISAGNILLAANQQGPIKGFITDLDCAYFEDETILSRETYTIALNPVNKYSDSGQLVSRTEPTTRTHTKFTYQQVKRAAPMSGTAQFMAGELLVAHTSNLPIKHEKHHDVESFIWVLSYCVMRYLLEMKDKIDRKELSALRPQFDTLKASFDLAFGQTTRDTISSERHSQARALEFIGNVNISGITSNYLSDAVVRLFEGLQTSVHLASPPMPVPIPLTHEAILTQVNAAIESLLLP